MKTSPNKLYYVCLNISNSMVYIDKLAFSFFDTYIKFSKDYKFYFQTGENVIDTNICYSI